jgi:hypothetical protein
MNMNENEKRSIYLFTKDRPETLRNTLNSITNTQYEKVIIDDSCDHTNRAEIQQIAKVVPHAIYIGQNEFYSFAKSYNINLKEFSFMLRQPGVPEWNLGFIRNLALLYSLATKADKVLFMDDDIEVPDLKLIDELFKEIDEFQFVGANILGLIDDSILGHIATKLEIFNQRMLSGGFMLFKPKSIDHFFLNNYNEDWIWLFLQLKGNKYLQTGNVYQALADPFLGYRQKVMFQEFGEIVLDGILDLYDGASYEILTEITFWERMLKERQEYLNRLVHESEEKGLNQYIDIINYVQLNSKPFNPLVFKTLFEEYFENRNAFKKILNSL